MISIIIIIAISLLALLGLSELIHGISLILFSPKKKAVTCSVLYLNNGDAEQQLHYAIQQKNWLGSRYADHLIAVSSGLSNENFQSCKYIAEHNNVIYCPLEVLESVVKSLSRG